VEKDWARKQIRRAFDEYNRDLLLSYEIAYFLVKCGLDADKALKIVEEEMFGHKGSLGVIFLPIEFVDNFHERIRKTTFYNEWLKTAGREKCKLATMGFLKIPGTIDYHNPGSLMIRFRDGTEITVGECRSVFLRSLKWFGRIEVTRYEFLGYLINIEKYAFEKALILTNITHSLIDMLDLTYIQVNEEIAKNLKMLGTYDLWNRMSICYNWENSSPAFILKSEYFDEERNWIDYDAIKRQFRITL